MSTLKTLLGNLQLPTHLLRVLTTFYNFQFERLNSCWAYNVEMTTVE